MNVVMSEVCWDYGPGEVDTGLVKLEPNSVWIAREQSECLADTSLHNQFNAVGRTRDPEPNKSPNESSTCQSGTCIVDQEKSQVDDSTPCSTSPISSTPICRQFWKAGVYNEGAVSVNTRGSLLSSAGSRINIHPKFLHSNATSHKWAFGAIAELLDNVVDEIQNGATFVYIDKTINPRNESPALLIQDDGAGMNPEGMRQCLSFGFSDKKSISAIGKYGNGFKTSTMRLGADAIVFSRNLVESTRTYTQSIGLLSYTFLIQSGYDRIVVPMVHYKFNFTKGCFESLQPKSDEQSNSNLSVLLRWSPYSTEEELLKQFEYVGTHGTKVIVYNLWLDDEGKMELDFDSDPEDIRIGCDRSKAKHNSLKEINEDHIANRLQYSLRAYLSMLYLKLPDTFCMILRGKVVLYHNIATELKHPEFIMYRAHSGGRCEGEVVTTIGFLKEAPAVNIHGFNIYHKSRLILPFLQVAPYSNNRGRGVVGVLEANFIEPTHSKQDFEKTNVFQKLVARLKDMTHEYWDYHCGLIGYQPPKKARSLFASPGSASPAPPSAPSRKTDVGGCSKSLPTVTQTNKRAVLNANSTIIEPVELVPCLKKGSSEGSCLKRKIPDQPKCSPSNNPKTARSVGNTGTNMHDNEHNQKKTSVMQEYKKLQMQCLEFEKAEEALNIKVMQLKTELGEAQREYAALLSELQRLVQVHGGKLR